MFQTYGFTPSGYAGATVKRRVTTREVATAVNKHKFLIDEHALLTRAIGTNDVTLAKRVWKSLAKQRDKLKRKAVAAAEGKTAKQIAGRVAVGILTFGTAELARKFNEKKISKARKKRAQAYLAQSDAASKLLRYWKEAFQESTRKLKAKPASALSVKEKQVLKSADADAANLEALAEEGSMAAETDKPSTPEEIKKEEAAEAEVEAEAPAAAVEAAASTEDPIAVAAPTTAPEPTSVTAAGKASEPEGMSTNMKIGIAAAGVGLIALLALRR